MLQFDAKFIVTKDKLTAEKFIAAGFSVISESGGCYVLLNQPPKNFRFNGIDRTKFCYTNMLCM